MKWLQLIITVPSITEIESISDLLESEGALSVTLQDDADEAILEPLPNTTPLWQKTKIIALFETPHQCAVALKQVKAVYPKIESYTEILPDQDWLKSSIADFKATCFGGRLWIYPSWEPCPDAQGICMQLDPGLAFGTGTHPTTALCLEWLAQQDLLDKTLIDYGCGSGILAIAALKLGAQKVWAVDIDPQALLACRSNAHNNKIPETALEIGFPETLPAVHVDILVANILAQPLITLAQKLVSFLKPQGELLLTGILQSQQELLLQHYQQFRSMTVVKNSGDWVLLRALPLI